MNLDQTALIKGSQWIDAHSHCDLYPRKQKLYTQVEIKKILILNSGTDPKSIRKGLLMEQECPRILSGAGIHPWKAALYTPDDLEQYKPLYRDAFQISEIGLDTVWAPREASLDKQEALLRKQLEWAGEMDKAVTLHTKGAESRIIEILKDYNLEKILIHWFDGSLEQLNSLLLSGCYFTLPPALKTDEKCKSLIREIPLNRILPETDNPPTWPWLFDAPPSPIQIKDVHEWASVLLKSPIEDLTNQFKSNLLDFFKIK